MATKKQESIFGLMLAALAFLVLYMLNKSGLLHESVQTTIVSGSGTITPDPETGLPRFDSRIPETVPRNFGFAVAPIGLRDGSISNHPDSIIGAACPIECDKYIDVSDNSVWCVPRIVDVPKFYYTL